jgi:hypothetical protein
VPAVFARASPKRQWPVAIDGIVELEFLAKRHIGNEKQGAGLRQRAMPVGRTHRFIIRTPAPILLKLGLIFDDTRPWAFLAQASSATMKPAMSAMSTVNT